MVIPDASNGLPPPLRAPRGRLLAICLAVVVAVTAGGAAMWLATAGNSRPWEDAFGDLLTSGENCLADGDVAARASARFAQSQSQLEGFVRERFEQFRSHAALAQVEQQRAAAAPASAQSKTAEATEADRLQARLTMLTGERWQLLERLTPEHPLVADLSSQIADLEGQLATLGPVPDHGDRLPAIAAEPVPAMGWQALVEQSAAEYEQLVAVCRRAERQFDETLVSQSAALDRHASALEYWDEAAESWGKTSTGKQAAQWILWSVTAAAMAMLVWLAASGMAGSRGTDTEEVLTSASQIERWFSVSAVSISPTRTESHSAKIKPRRTAPRWLVLPAQFAMAIAVFALVAATIQNPSWLGEMASEPWQTIGRLCGR